MGHYLASGQRITLMDLAMPCFNFHRTFLILMNQGADFRGCVDGLDSILKQAKGLDYCVRLDYTPDLEHKPVRVNFARFMYLRFILC